MTMLPNIGDTVQTRKYEGVVTRVDAENSFSPVVYYSTYQGAQMWTLIDDIVKITRPGVRANGFA